MEVEYLSREIEYLKKFLIFFTLLTNHKKKLLKTFFLN